MADELDEFEILGVPQLSDYAPDDPTLNITYLNISACDVILAQDLYQPKPFEASHRLKATNEAAIRFGNPKDMIHLLEGTNDEQEDYLIGLIATSIVIAVFFVVWSILILVFKYTPFQQRLFGFLCGRFVRPPRPTEMHDEIIDDSVFEEIHHPHLYEHSTFFHLHSNQEHSKAVAGSSEKHETINSKGGSENNARKSDTTEIEEEREKTEFPVGDDGAEKSEADEWVEWEIACHRQCIRRERISYVVALCCLVIIVSAILFCIYGNKYLNSSFSEVKYGLEQIEWLCRTGVRLIDFFIARQNFASDKTREVMESVFKICPIQVEKFCDVSGITFDTCNITVIPEVNQTLMEIYELVEKAKTHILDEITDFRDDLEDTADEINKFLNAQVNLEWAFWVSFGFTILLGCLCVLIVWGIVEMEYFGKRLRPWQEFGREQVMIPLFCGFAFIAYVFAVAFVLAAVGASDWCINSPNAKTTSVLYHNKDKIDSIIYAFADYYVNSCDPDLAPIKLLAHSDALVRIIEYINDLFLTTQTIDPEGWKSNCGTNFTSLEMVVDVLQGNFCLLSHSLEDVNRYFWCRMWNPVYQTFMYGAICYDAQQGLAWVAATMFAILFFAFIVLLLRASVFEVEEYHEYRTAIQRDIYRWKQIITCCGLCCRRRNRERHPEQYESFTIGKEGSLDPLAEETSEENGAEGKKENGAEGKNENGVV